VKNKRVADAHGVLGIAPGATAADVKRAYRRRARLLHPDIAGPHMTSRMAELNLARDALMADFPPSAHDVADVPVEPAAPAAEPSRPPDHEAAWEDYWSTWTKSQAPDEVPEATPPGRETR
jgi:curved DNA-binding protein CbpA